MNRLAQALHYFQKVFGLKTRLRAVQDQRPQAKIQTLSVLLCLFLGVFTRVSSYLDLAQQTQRRRWRRLCHLKAAVGDDLFGYVTERLDAEDLRQGLAGCVKTLKQKDVYKRQVGIPTRPPLDRAARLQERTPCSVSLWNDFENAWHW